MIAEGPPALIWGALELSADIRGDFSYALQLALAEDICSDILAAPARKRSDVDLPRPSSKSRLQKSADKRYADFRVAVGPDSMHEENTSSPRLLAKLVRRVAG